MQRIIPAVCSFFVIGLGQIIKGGKENSRKGLLLILTCYFALPLGLYFILMLMPGLVFLFSLAVISAVIIGLWLYSVVDALK